MNNMENSVKNVLHMESITMQFGGVVAVNGLTLDVNEHEIVALIGPNGAGKTTAFNCVTGIYQPTFGSVSFNGEVILADTPQGKMRRLYEGDITPTDLTPVRKTPDQVTKLGIARTFQNIRLFGALTVFENVLIAKHMRAKQNVFSATLRLNHAEEKRMREESMELLEMQGLAHVKDEIASSLPYGLQRRLEIARALATSPSLLLLDEPAAGMNSKEKMDLTDYPQSQRRLPPDYLHDRAPHGFGHADIRPHLRAGFRQAHSPRHARPGPEQSKSNRSISGGE